MGLYLRAARGPSGLPLSFVGALQSFMAYAAADAESADDDAGDEDGTVMTMMIAPARAFLAPKHNRRM